MQAVMRRLSSITCGLWLIALTSSPCSAQSLSPWEELRQRCLNFEATSDVGQFLQRIRDDFSSKPRRFAPTGWLDTTRCFAAKATDDYIHCELRTRLQVQDPAGSGIGALNIVYYLREDLLLIIGSHGLPAIKADGKGSKLLTEDVRQRLWKAAGRLERDDLRAEIMENETLLPEEARALLQRIYEDGSATRLSDFKTSPVAH